MSEERSPIPAMALLLACLLASSPASAHPGGLDTNGCHYDSSTGR